MHIAMVKRVVLIEADTLRRFLLLNYDDDDSDDDQREEGFCEGDIEAGLYRAKGGEGKRTTVGKILWKNVGERATGGLAATSKRIWGERVILPNI